MTRFSQRPALLSVLVLVAVLAAACTAIRGKPKPEPAALPAFDVPIDAYVEAQKTGGRTTITGKAYQERRKPGSPDEPLVGTVITLMPYSESLHGRLEALKKSSRQSADQFVAAAPEIKKLREAYETALWEHGGADFILTATAQPDGSFRLDDVPPGRWLLYATRADLGKKDTALRASNREGWFIRDKRLQGFYVVMLWLEDLRTGTTAPDAIELTDRNVWFTGIAEEWVVRPRPKLPAGPR